MTNNPTVTTVEIRKSSHIVFLLTFEPDSIFTILGEIKGFCYAFQLNAAICEVNLPHFPVTANLANPT